MSLFSNLFANVKSVVSGNVEGNNFQLETDEKKVCVRFSVADETTVQLDETVVTVKDAIEAACRLSSTQLENRKYTVLMNGQPVELSAPYVNGAVYKLSFNAGVAG